MSFLMSPANNAPSHLNSLTSDELIPDSFSVRWLAQAWVATEGASPSDQWDPPLVAEVRVAFLEQTGWKGVHLWTENRANLS